jgi:hypothetical protein
MKLFSLQAFRGLPFSKFGLEMIRAIHITENEKGEKINQG